MATLLKLKAQVEEAKGTRMKVVFSGASEAHLLAEEIGKFLYYNLNFRTAYDYL